MPAGFVKTTRNELHRTRWFWWVLGRLPATTVEPFLEMTTNARQARTSSWLLLTVANALEQRYAQFKSSEQFYNSNVMSKQLNNRAIGTIEQLNSRTTEQDAWNFQLIKSEGALEAHNWTSGGPWGTQWNKRTKWGQDLTRSKATNSQINTN